MGIVDFGNIVREKYKNVKNAKIPSQVDSVFIDCNGILYGAEASVYLTGTDKKTKKPVCVGFGISEPEHVNELKKLSNGKYDNCDYDIRKRLVSSRGIVDGKDISSSDYFQSKMKKENIQSVTIIILQTSNRISPTYLESNILQLIYSETDSLPDWNNSF